MSAKDNRLVVQVLIDGQEPDIEQFGTVRATRSMGGRFSSRPPIQRRLAISVLEKWSIS